MSHQNKKLSGAQNLKRKLKKQNDDEKSAKRMAGFVIREVRSEETGECSAESSTKKNESCLEINKNNTSKVSPDKLSHQAVCIKQYENYNLEENKKNSITKVSSASLSGQDTDFTDVAKWPLLVNSSIIDEIVIRGPVNNKIQNDKYPRNSNGRHFSNVHFQRVMPNGEIYDRRWLVYSQSTDKVFCFCCSLFYLNHHSNLSKEGFNDWKHLSDRLKSHEISPDHLHAIEKWIETLKRLKLLSGIDKHLQRQIHDEKLRWTSILHRLIEIILFLSGRNLSFRGSSDKFNTLNNGNFLGLVELLSKFDSVMMEHLRRVINQETHVHYCSKMIQNELISLLAGEVRNKILSLLKEAKYFSIILDCTPDVSHIEQLSFTVRFVDINEARVRECFIAYKPVTDSTGEGLTDLFLDNIVQKYDLDMNDCRGQGYDNGANMVGKNKGLQARILKKFPRAFFNPCGCHSLNLVVADAVKTSVKSVSLFGILQRLFVLFSASPKRWKIMEKYVKFLSLKKVCETRWESRISSLEAVRFQYSDVLDALNELYKETDDPVSASEAKSLAEHMESFEFLLTLVVWYDILFQINIVSKAMQSETMDISNACKLLEHCQTFITGYRDTARR